MDIHVTSSIGTGRIRSTIEEHILEAGHKLAERKEFASYGIGFQDSDFGPIPPKGQIIIHEGYSIVSKEGQNFLHPGTFQVLRTGKSLSEWLQTAPDPLSEVM